MKRFLLIIGCFALIGHLMAQTPEPASGFNQMEPGHFLLQARDFCHLHPYIDKEEYFNQIQHALDNGEVSTRDFEWMKAFILESGPEKRSRVMPVPARRGHRDRLELSINSQHQKSRLRKRLMDAGVFTGIPETEISIIKSGAPSSSVYKLDSTRSGLYDPNRAAWVDHGGYGTFRNDTGRVIGGYSINQVNDEGKVDTVYRYYYEFDEDESATLRTSYQFDYDLMLLMPEEKRLYQSFQPDSTVEIAYKYDRTLEDWVLFEKWQNHYEDEQVVLTEIYIWTEESGTWSLNRKSVPGQSEDGLITWSTSWKWDEFSGEMVPDTRFERGFDQFGNQVLSASSRWNIDDNDWRTRMKWTRDYGDYNRILEYKFHYWLEDSLGLSLLGQTDYQYENDTMLTSMTRYNYERDSAKIFPTELERYYYSELLKRDSTLIFSWDRNIQDWELQSKIEYTYDEEGLLILELTSSWLKYEFVWRGSEKNENEYDQQGRLIRTDTYRRHTTNSTWLKSNRRDYSYDSYGNVSQTVDWVVDEWTDEWMPNLRELREYTEAGFTVHRTLSHWDLEAGAWTWRSESFKYSEEGYVEMIGYNRSASEGSMGWNSRTELSYNDEDMFSEWMEHYWDSAENAWVEEYRGVCTYGNQGKIVSCTDSYPDELSDQWIDDSRVDADYDENGRITSLSFLEWNREMQEWELWEVDSFGYDEQGRINMFLLLVTESESDRLVNRWKSEYTYDEGGNPETETFFEWDDVGAAWIGEERYEYGFNGNDQLISMKAFMWNGEGSSWEVIYMEEFTYTALGNRSLMTQSAWDSDNGVWVLGEKMVYIYDGHGNLLNKVTSYWDLDSEGWISYLKENYTFDSGIEADDVYLPLDIGYNSDEIFELRYDNSYFEYFYDASAVEEMLYWNFNVFEFIEIHERINAPSKVVYQEWNEEQEEWQDREITNFHISSFKTSIESPENLEEAGFRIYPNPVSELLIIEFPESEGLAAKDLMISVYRLDGRQALSVVSGSGDQIDVSQLESGAYIVMVRSNEMSHYGKFIKR